MKYVYEPRYCDTLKAHFSNPAGSWSEDEKGKRTYIANPLPTFPGFAIKIGVPQRVLLEWVKLYEDFAHAWEMAEETQRDVLTQNMLRGAYNSTSAIYAAKNLMQWNTAQADIEREPITGEEISDKELVRRIMFLASGKKSNPMGLAPDSNTDIIAFEPEEDQ